MSKKKRPLGPGMAYNTKVLNRIFALLGTLFLIAMIWVFLDDYIRPWKLIQIEGMKVKKEVLQAKIAEEEQKIDQEELAKLRTQLEQSKEELKNFVQEFNQIDEEIFRLVAREKRIKIQNSGVSGLASELAYKASHAHKEKHYEEAQKYSKRYDRAQKEVAKNKEQLKAVGQKIKELRQQRAEIASKVTLSEDEIKKITAAQDLLLRAKSQVEPSLVSFLRNLPFIDFMDPTIQIQQVVLDRVTDDRYFQQVPKVDRCTTCHMFIDDKMFAAAEKKGMKIPQPFRAHPNLELMVDMNSPHPLKEFGCTSCHQGEGHRVNDFSAPAHMPQDEYQAAVWKKKYHWHEPHRILQPMFKNGQAEASCVKCHSATMHIPEGTVVNEGRKLLQTYGCYACHKIAGWEHLRKPAPSLLKIKGKVSKEFARNWIWDPFGFNPHSRMPSYFNQSNNSDHQHMVKNIAEVNAMVAYLWEASEDYQSKHSYQGGDVSRGKTIVKEIGCLGCHQVEGIKESQEVGERFGPYLVNLGSKLSGEWLVTWLREPQHYWEDTKMPSMRLTQKDAQDVAAFLLSSKNETFAQTRFAELDPAVRDELLVKALSSFDTEKSALNKVHEMPEHQRTLELGRRSINKYGCYTCHEIKGFDGLPPIGPELTHVGSKPIDQIDFGTEKMPHQRDLWLSKHLENPRRWDVGVKKAFKDLNRMPNFNLNQEQIKKIVVALLGQVKDYVPRQGMKNLSATEAKVEAGARVIARHNCMGCHQIDQLGGSILKAYQEDINLGPPQLNKEGERVHSQWLYHFLDNVHLIRPSLSVRMPSFKLTEEEKNLIAVYFAEKVGKPLLTKIHHKVIRTQGEVAGANKLFNELACATCHTTGFNKQEASAPDLHHAAMRLRPEWMYSWLYNPYDYLPETSMPAFWPEGESDYPDILEGSTSQQIEALVKWIQSIGKKDYPKAFPKEQPWVNR